MECRCVADAGASGLFGERQRPAGRALVAVGAGDAFAVGVDGHGRVVGWGRAFYGELGEGEDADGDAEGDDSRACFRELAVPTDCARVACGRNHVLALSRDGASVFAWGWNRWGQVGDVPRATVTTPARVQLGESAPSVRSIAAGGMHSLAVDASGAVWSWGQNKFGQLGRAFVDSERCGVPGRVALPSDAEARQAAAGWAHSGVVTTDGRVLTFGWGLYHQLGHGTTQDERRPVVVDALLGLDEASRVVQVACGTWHTIARTASGDLYSWGWGPDGQLGHGRATTSQVYPRVVDLLNSEASATAPSSNAVREQGDACDVLDVSCGARLTACLLKSGRVMWCGLDYSSAASTLPWRVAHRYNEEQERVQGIATGTAHVYALVASKPVDGQEADRSSAAHGDVA